MTPTGQTICLAMIVKDEAPVLKRCLESVKPFIDSFVIIDTGSTDNTKKIARRFFENTDIKGSVISKPWIDFATNRNQALAHAELKADYVLVIDADDQFFAPDGWSWPDLDADAYSVKIQDSSIIYDRIQLFKSSEGYRYKGVLHEFPEIKGDAKISDLPLIIKRNHDGARRRDPNTYLNDALLLEGALTKETDELLRCRYTFYLAQSYRDAQEFDQAFAMYLERAQLGGWNEEVYVSLVEAGKIVESYRSDYKKALEIYERALKVCPHRSEARMAIARVSRQTGDEVYGMSVAAAGLDFKLPEGLFIEPWVYTYGLLDEYAVTAYYAQNYLGSLEACVKILSQTLISYEHRARVAQNAQFAIAKLKG